MVIVFFWNLKSTFKLLLFKKRVFIGGDMKGQAIMSGFDISSRDRVCPKCFLKFSQREDEFDDYENNTALQRFLKLLNGEIKIEDLKYQEVSFYFEGLTIF